MKRTSRSWCLILKTFALVCVSIRGLAIDGAEGAFLRQVESGSVPVESPGSPGAGDLFEILGTSMTYLASDGPLVASPDRGATPIGAESRMSAERLAATLLKPPCA